jgi:predicted DNA-binding transcriptional regulator YafY
MSNESGKQPSRQAQLVRQWRILVELTHHPEGRSVHQLGKVAGTEGRTVYRDLATLKAAGFRIERAQVHGQSMCRLSDAAPLAIGLNRDELAALALASHMVMSFQGSPFHGAMVQAIRKIQGLAGREGAQTFEVASRTLYAGMRRARAYTQKEVWFREILDGINRHRTLHLKYFTQERGAAVERDVDPYGLMVHEGAFYLVGWCHLRKARRTFLVERVQYAKTTGRVFDVPADFSLQDHFKHAWSVIRDKALVCVRVRFDKSVAGIIREGRWHDSQKLEPGPNGSVILCVHVAGLDEIKRWILTYGPLAIVLEPPELRDAVISDARAILAAYDPE